MTAADSSAESSNASNAGARVRQFDLANDRQRAELYCNQPAIVVLASDHLATVAALNELQRELEAERARYRQLEQMWRDDTLANGEAKTALEDSLSAERERREKAEANERRYLWLRDQRRWLYNLPPTPGISLRWENYVQGNEWIDAAIDAALAPKVAP